MKKSSKLKVLLCSPRKGAVGGISRWTSHVIRYYKTADTMIALDHYYPRITGVYQNTNSYSRIKIGIKTYTPFLLGLKEKISQDNFDVVHIVSSASMSLIRDLISLKIVKRKNLKTIVHFRFGRIPDLFRKMNWEQKLLSRVILLADKVIVLDKKSYDVLHENGFDNIELLPNPLSKNVENIITNNTDIVRDERKLLFAGHVVETKGIFELIDACKNLDNITLKIVGKITNEMQQVIIQRAGVDHSKWLEIVGEKSIEITIKEMLSAGIFVLPTHTEGFPNVIIESMACACPIITTKVGAIPQMLDIENGENYGICIDAKNSEQLSSAIKKMLIDRKYALSCGLNAQKRVHEKYSMESVTDEMEKIWESVL